MSGSFTEASYENSGGRLERHLRGRLRLCERHEDKGNYEEGDRLVPARQEQGHVRGLRPIIKRTTEPTKFATSLACVRSGCFTRSPARCVGDQR
jgi:hypothetical protein